jgi:hypothetical protein
MGLAERMPVAGMRERLLEGRGADAERLRRDGHPPPVQRPQRQPEPFPGSAEERVRRHADVVKLEVHASQPAHAQRIGGHDARDARRVEGNEEGADAAAAHAGLRGGEDDRDLGDFRIGHPDLPAIEDVAAVVEVRQGLLVGGIGAGPRFRERKRADGLPTGQPSEPGLLRPSVPNRAIGSATSELFTAAMTATTALACASASMAST